MDRAENQDYYGGGDMGDGGRQEGGYNQGGGPEGGYGRNEGGGGGYGRQEGGYNQGGGQGGDYNHGGYEQRPQHHQSGGHDYDQGGQGQGGNYGSTGSFGGGNAPQGGNYPGGGGYGNDDDDDLQGAAKHASEHAGGSGDSNMFSSILSGFMGNKQNIGQQPINEQRISPFSPSPSLY
jgi:hypothetical protein